MPTRHNYPIADGQLTLFEHLFEDAEADALMQALLQEVDWQQGDIMLFGKRRTIPRLQAWYGELGYRYSGKTLLPRPLTPTLARIQHRVEQCSQQPFNGVLANLYRDGEDSMGWHSDDEKALGPDPTVASVSLGQQRKFSLRHKQSGERLDLALSHNSLLLMAGALQHHWQHQLPKTRRALAPRINLTYRYLWQDAATSGQLSD